MMRISLSGIVFALAMAFSASIASAITVTNVANRPASWGLVDLDDTLSLDGGIWSAAPTTRAGSIGGVTRSPFDGDIAFPAGARADWERISYWSVGPDNPSNPAILTYATDRTFFSFLWGSVDTYNALEFYKDGGLVTTVTNADILGAVIGLGASFVTVADILFDQVNFVSNQNAFEFSNISATIPLPSALPLFGTGLGILGFLGWRRRRKPTQAV